jgi:hypothetical protein
MTTLRTLRLALVLYGVLDFLIGYAGFIPIENLAAAQFTTVTGTVTDPNGVPYKFGTIAPKLIVPSGAGTPAFCTTPSTPYIPPAISGLDTTGHFILNVADNTQLCPASTTWNFTVCSFQGTVNPAFGTGSQCFTLPAGITISGTTQDITTQLNASALPLTLPFSNAGTGCVVSPLTNQAIVFISSSNCTTTAALGYNNFQANFLTVGAPGNSTGGYTVRGTTSGSSTWTTNATALITFWNNQSSMSFAFDRDTATAPINFNRIRSMPAPGPTLVADGLEWSGSGDIQGSGSAAGFKVVNAANTLDASPGANNSITAGNSIGGTANSSHGGDNSLIAGAYTGAGNNRGGDVILTAGNSSGSGRGGNVSVTTGTSSSGSAGQFLINGTAFPQPTILQQFTATLGSNVPLPNSNTSIVSQAITFPATGCPCRVHAAWTLYLTTANSGFDAAYVCDTAAPTCSGANGFAPGATTTTGSSNAFAMSAAGTSTVTYANNASVTFTLVGAGTHGGGGSTVTTAPAASPAISLTGLPNSELNLIVFSSN